MRQSILFTLTVVFVFCLAAMAQDPPTPAPTPTATPQLPTGFPGLPGREPVIQPFEKVITKEAKTEEGVFKVHRIKDKIYYEIPKAELGKEFLLVTQIARTKIGIGYGGEPINERVIKWERRDNRILLKDIDYDLVATASHPMAQAVRNANNDSIMMSFFIEALGKDDAPVIEVTRLFTTDVVEMSARQALRATMLDPTRSFIERATAFPENIEIESTLTFMKMPDPVSPTGLPSPTILFGPRGMPAGSASLVMHFSMVKLPEKLMIPRLHDDRVGFFSVSNQDFSSTAHKVDTRRYITRWRLEKKDPNAAMSEPVKPIVYYIDPATPTIWVPYIKRGIEKWQPAFEEAGFKNAIIAKEAPKDDPKWSPEDARISCVRWLPSTTENAYGPHISDPRTGEILESDIHMFHNIMNLQRAWYFTQVGPLDPRAAKFPLPNDLMGELIEYVVAHEVGHTLGYPHNFKSSSTYAAEKVRDRDWVKKMGHTPSLMDYSRFNYVAQPEDKIDLKDLIPGIGPYDKFVTMWGYKPIPAAKTPDEEKATLNEWAKQQDKTPWLRFSTPKAMGADPGDQTEAVGDADALYATTYGMKNIKRVADMLVTATTTQNGENYDDLSELYSRMMGQWVTELRHVIPIVGGMNSQQKHIGQDGAIFTPLTKEKQMAAVKFLHENAFATPTWALKPDILRRIESIGALDRIKSYQTMLLSSLLTNSRLARLTEQQAVDGAAAYHPIDFLTDVRKGIFSELSVRGGVKIDAYRRNLQRAYLDNMGDKLNGRFAASDDTRGLVRSELRALRQDVTLAMAGADRSTRAHLDDVKDQIAKILDPKFVAAATSTNPLAALLGRLDDLSNDRHNCWEDVIFTMMNQK